MSRLCERPGCSDLGAAAYGMVPEDLLFWIAALDDESGPDVNVLCRRHADAMVVPRGWTLDDRREEFPRLFKPRQAELPIEATTRRRRQRHADDPEGAPEQLQIDGTGEIRRPTLAVDQLGDPQPGAAAAAEEHRPWQPDFDTDDDLDGLLEVSSPLLARAFLGTDRRRS
jgi:Protein of unknown function (DUF3499)